MNDAYDEQRILDYLEGDLPPAEREAFEGVLRRDARLKSLVDRLAADRQAMRSLSIETPPAALMETVNEQLERSMLLDDVPASGSATDRRRTGFRADRFFAWAAMAAMLIMTASLIVLTLTDRVPLQLARLADQPPPLEVPPKSEVATTAPTDSLALAAPSEGRLKESALEATPMQGFAARSAGAASPAQSPPISSSVQTPSISAPAPTAPSSVSPRPGATAGDAMTLSTRMERDTAESPQVTTPQQLSSLNLEPSRSPDKSDLTRKTGPAGLDMALGVAASSSAEPHDLPELFAFGTSFDLVDSDRSAAGTLELVDRLVARSMAQVDETVRAAGGGRASIADATDAQVTPVTEVEQATENRNAELVQREVRVAVGDPAGVHQEILQFLKEQKEQKLQNKVNSAAGVTAGTPPAARARARTEPEPQPAQSSKTVTIATPEKPVAPEDAAKKVAAQPAGRAGQVVDATLTRSQLDALLARLRKIDGATVTVTPPSQAAADNAVTSTPTVEARAVGHLEEVLVVRIVIEPITGASEHPTDRP